MTYLLTRLRTAMFITSLARAIARLQNLGLLALAMVLGAVSPAHAGDSAHTRYPIVLVHGLFGFDQMLGVDYFYRVPAALRKEGAQVFVAQVSAVNTAQVRGEQLIQQMQQWSAATGATRFNLVGHSLGGLTARYVAAVRPDMVVSVTTIGTPHDIQPGDPLATMGLDQPALQKQYNSIGETVSFLTGQTKLPQDAAAMAEMFLHLDAFNASYPLGRPTKPCGEGPEVAGGIRFYSAGGNVKNTNAWDISESIFPANNAPDSDGFVTACGSHWGKVVRDNYPWNHLDQVNHLFGLIGKGAPDPVAFYVQQANRLKGAGL
jgi:triacylglycerol lipase